VQSGSLPCAAVQKAGWATACWPGPAAEAVRELRWARWRVVTARSLCAGQRGGTVVEAPVVASRRQGVDGELEETNGRVSGKEGAGGAHRGGGAMMRRRGGSVQRRMAGSSPEGGSAATPASSWSCRGGQEK
jgi:hypothetical protein